jgi:23S rRNA maturation-related 3'-5' exoribonuclease YhaM
VVLAAAAAAAAVLVCGVRDLDLQSSQSRGIGIEIGTVAETDQRETAEALTGVLMAAQVTDRRAEVQQLVLQQQAAALQRLTRHTVMRQQQ